MSSFVALFMNCFFSVRIEFWRASTREEGGSVRRSLALGPRLHDELADDLSPTPFHHRRHVPGDQQIHQPSALSLQAESSQDSGKSKTTNQRITTVKWLSPRPIDTKLSFLFSVPTKATTGECSARSERRRGFARGRSDQNLQAHSCPSKARHSPHQQPSELASFPINTFCFATLCLRLRS